MIAVDTNILVYAHRKDAQFYDSTSKLIRELSEGRRPWIIPHHCLVEFYAIATHPRIYTPASTPQQAAFQIISWLQSPSLHVATSSSDSMILLTELAETYKISGPQIHDLRILVDCMQAGVDLLYTVDRNLSRFTGLGIEFKSPA